MKEITKELLSIGITRHYPATDDALHEALAFVEGVLDESGCSLPIQMKMAVVVEEIFVNVAHYAYGELTGDLDMTLAIGDTPKGKALAVGFKDRGMPFDPLAMEDPDVTLPVRERGIGGLGIFMVKKMTDGVYYEYEDGQNCLMFIKLL